MCEIHFYKCKGCGLRWEEWRKLPSCDSSDRRAKCDDSLCLYAGSAKKPEVEECDGCRWNRDNGGSSRGNSPTSPRESGGAGGKRLDEAGSVEEMTEGTDRGSAGRSKSKVGTTRGKG